MTVVVNATLAPRLSYWDAMIVAAAYEGGAATLFTEDLNQGQMIEGMRVVNPLVDSNGIVPN